MKSRQFRVNLNPKILNASLKNMITFHDAEMITPVDDPARKFSAIEEDKDHYGFSVPYDETSLLRIKPKKPPELLFYTEAFLYDSEKKVAKDEDDPLIISCYEYSKFTFKKMEKLKDTQAKWTSTTLSFDKKMYCSPGLETRILQVDTNGDDAEMILYNIDEIKSIQKTNNTFGKKFKDIRFPPPKITYSSEDDLILLSKNMSNLEISEFSSFLDFKKLYEKSAKIKLDAQYPNLIEIERFPGKYTSDDTEVENQILYLHEECIFGKTINAPNTKETFFIPWSSNMLIKIIPRNSYFPKIFLFSLNLPKDDGDAKNGLFLDSIYCKRNDSIYCIPWNAKYILQIIPRKEKTEFQIIKNLPISPTKQKRFSSAVIGYDQNIYCIPYDETMVLQIKILDEDPFVLPELNKLDLKFSTLEEHD